MSHSSESFDLAELQLERELRQMFEVDSQKDVETYLNCVRELNDLSWQTDIQTMYRAIHTIKGGSVTVKADAILQVATVLEDMLSELRYIETIPDLDNGNLRQMLQEGGEIIASVLGSHKYGKETLVVESKIEHIQDLKQQIQATYLAEWNEQTQLQIEFAEEGFDLVMLDLEVAIDRLSPDETVPQKTLELATGLIEELTEIGRDLELASGWNSLLEEASRLIRRPDANLWKAQWAQYFADLKTCVKQGGKTTTETVESIDEPTVNIFNLDRLNNLIDDVEQITNNGLSVVNQAIETATDTFDCDEIIQLPKRDKDELAKAQKSSSNSSQVAFKAESGSTPSSNKADWEIVDPSENIQVPIPLTKLNRSAQSIIDTLMIARTMESYYQSLHQDLKKLIGIAKDSVSYLAQLRQIQNDYTVLNDLDRQLLQKTNRPTLERYRKGYVTINRLLENSLRLAEVGTEAEQTAQETAEKLQQLNKSIVELKDIVEDTRLVPFRNLTFRVRAIVRDLMTRYGKLVNLSVQGEQIELDVGTTRRLEPILLHLVRNAYDHGLESPIERVFNRKPEQGKIALTLQRFGSIYVLKLEDDGKGIDAKAIAAKAKKLKLPLTRTDTPSELLSVICQPGFSSTTEINEVSGRGVGMDVVAEQISLLNGSLSLETTPGKGTSFLLNFPVPHLLIPCLLVQSGDRTMAIPVEQIVTTSLWSNLNASPIKNSQSSFEWNIQEAEMTTPGVDLLSYWNPRYKGRMLSDSAIAVCVQSQSKKSSFWAIADKMLGRLDLKIQPLPAPLIAPQGIMGVSLQTDSSLIPVIEVNSLQEHLIASSSVVTTEERIADRGIFEDNHNLEESQTILIVDDAALMRRRIEASLSAYGYTTHTCVDGLEAWNWLKINPHPLLIITDIEMPNIDGFTLIHLCRQHNLTFPILVVSSRLAEEWGQEAERLGATDFLTKGFSTGELVSKVNSLFS